MTAKSFQLRGRDLPLWMWAIGYVEFLLQTLGPLRTPVGWISWAALLVVVLCTGWQRRRAWSAEARELKAAARAPDIALCLALVAGILLVGLFAALRPPHLYQEYDAIHYQMGVPWQLLVRHSLGPIDWAVTDLWPMALQWGLAPFAHAFATVNKLPQFFCALGVAACLYRTAGQLMAEPDRRVQLFPTVAFLGGHGVVTQIGSGMMDLPLIYFLLLTLTSLLDARWATAALALAVYTASKAFHPFQTIPLVLGGLLWLWLGRSRIEPRPVLRRFLPCLALFSALLFLRPAYQSMRATGTPLFPFAACRLFQGTLCTGDTRAALETTAKALLATRDGYGNGRGPTAFVLHLWRVAVPTAGVNNEFDYPLGLPWLLLLVLFAFAIPRGRWRSPLVQLALLFWLLWWLNAHQSRWLYPVLAFGFLATLGEQARARKTLPLLLAVSAAFSLLSLARSLRPTAFIPAKELQAQQEQKIRWSRPGRLDSLELLYVNEPAWDHSGGVPLWILR